MHSLVHGEVGLPRVALLASLELAVESLHFLVLMLWKVNREKKVEKVRKLKVTASPPLPLNMSPQNPLSFSDLSLIKREKKVKKGGRGVVKGCTLRATWRFMLRFSVNVQSQCSQLNTPSFIKVENLVCARGVVVLLGVCSDAKFFFMNVFFFFSYKINFFFFFSLIKYFFLWDFFFKKKKLTGNFQKKKNVYA